MNPRVLSILRFALIFLITYLFLQFFFPQQDPLPTEGSTIQILDARDSVAVALQPPHMVRNLTDEPITLDVEISTRQGSQHSSVTSYQLDLEPSTPTQLFSPEVTATYLRDPSQYVYDLSLADEVLSGGDLEISEPGFWRSLWNTLFMKPLLNSLVLFLMLTGGLLWAAIILLTLLVKLILYSPSQRALKAQKKMQKLQPEIDRVKKQHASDPQKQAQAMMDLWKKHEVNPAAALWPLLLQFPVLIGLFFVVKDGLTPLSQLLLYSPLADFAIESVDYAFLWMDLHDPDPLYALPFIVGALQFYQMRMIQRSREKKEDQTKSSTQENMAENLQRFMTFGLPLIITVFTLFMPSAVGLYWAVSTLFTIAQQYFVGLGGSTPSQTPPKSSSTTPEVVEAEVLPAKSRIKA